MNMSRELPFIVLCIEEYKNQKSMTGKEVMALFQEYAVCEYIRTFYDALHTMGTRCVVEDIDGYIRSRRSV